MHPPRITVEVGTPEEQQIISNELMIIGSLAERFDPPLQLAEIVVPNDFDAAVNRMQGTSDYSSERAQLVIAKTIPTATGVSFVFSPFIYTELFDFNIRLLTFTHELLHASNHTISPQPTFHPQSKNVLAANLYILVDEYLANVISLESTAECLQGDTQKYNEHINAFFKGHRDAVVNSRTRLDDLNNIITSLREHDDRMSFLVAWRDIFDELAKSLVYAVAYVDSSESFHVYEEEILRSPLATKSAVTLMQYIRQVGSLKNLDYEGTLPLIHDFIADFGISFDYTSGLSRAQVYELLKRTKIAELPV